MKPDRIRANSLVAKMIGAIAYESHFDAAKACAIICVENMIAITPKKVKKYSLVTNKDGRKGMNIKQEDNKDYIDLIEFKKEIEQL